MGSDYVMDKDTDAKLFAAALYVISDMWGKEMGDMQRASLANQIVREIERRAILAAPPSPRSEMREALEAARQFIVNGVELGYIHIPKNDPAEHTLGKINAALKES